MTRPAILCRRKILLRNRELRRAKAIHAGIDSNIVYEVYSAISKARAEKMGKQKEERGQGEKTRETQGGTTYSVSGNPGDERKQCNAEVSYPAGYMTSWHNAKCTAFQHPLEQT